MATDISKQCTLTNNSGWDVVVALAITTNESSSSNAITAANGQLEILKTAAGSTVIKNGSSDTVILDRNYTMGSGQTGSVPDYDLQICDSHWLSPIANLPVTAQTGNGATGFAPQTITKEGQTDMNAAADFYQTIMVYPDAQLTKDYTAALQAAQDAARAKADGSADSAAASARAIEETMNGFFKSTKDYPTVTLADVVAIDNYYNNFPAVWAQYKDDLTYYLYGSDGKTAVFAGALSLKKTGPMDATKPAGGYHCSFIPAITPTDTSTTDVDASKAVTLSYVDGVFVDDAKAAAPKIGLKGMFFLKRLFTNDPADNSLLTVITGTVNGIPCVGFDVPQPTQEPEAQQANGTLRALNADSFEQYWDTLLHLRNQHDLLISLLTLAGAIVLLPAAGAAVYGIYRAIKLRQAIAKQLVQKDWDEVKDAVRRGLIDFKSVSVGKYTGPLGTKLGEFWLEFNPANIEGFNKVLQNYELSCKLVRAFLTQKDAMQAVYANAEKLDPNTVRDTLTQMDAIDESIKTLTTCKPLDLENQLPQAYKNFAEVQTGVGAIQLAASGKLTRVVQRVVDENIEASNTIYKEIQETKAHIEKEETERELELEKKLIAELETF